ncbi:MAG: hypothetical protein HQM10_16585 [Candidatus Riflebacteria bacterium]|nr:hypothetical protein [Candidatus Riflebacteria bacterium]
MITYHPARDVNHCAFRLISLLRDIEQNKTDWERLKLLDFYFLFPHFLVDITLPRNPILTKKELQKIEKPYEAITNPRKMLFELRALHNAAIRGLVAKGIINKELFLKNIIKLEIGKLPEKLIGRIEENEKRATQWYRLIVNFLSKFPFNGKDGLKERSGLLEFRYDPS